MSKNEFNAGDICFVSFRNGMRWLGKFKIAYTNSDGDVCVIFEALDLRNGTFGTRELFEDSVNWELIEHAEPKMLDKAMKVREMYLSALGAIGNECEKNAAIDGCDSNN